MIQTAWKQHYLKHWIMVVGIHTYYEFIPQNLMSQDLWLENLKEFFPFFFFFPVLYWPSLVKEMIHILIPCWIVFS